MRRDRTSGSERVPPGQHLTRGWPVLHSGAIPPFEPARWRFRTSGAVEEPLDLSWDELRALPVLAPTTDIHCVTGWSRLDVAWEGIAFGEIARRTRPLSTATHVLVKAPYGYDANLPLAAVLEDDVLFAWSAGGKPLAPDHGGPLRLVVPKLYFWKSVKWANEVEFLSADRRGYWEERGYHNRADPWNEERYSWQE